MTTSTIDGTRVMRSGMYLLTTKELRWFSFKLKEHREHAVMVVVLMERLLR